MVLLEIVTGKKTILKKTQGKKGRVYFYKNKKRTTEKKFNRSKSGIIAWRKRARVKSLTMIERVKPTKKKPFFRIIRSRVYKGKKKAYEGGGDYEAFTVYQTIYTDIDAKSVAKTETDDQIDAFERAFFSQHKIPYGMRVEENFEFEEVDEDEVGNVYGSELTVQFANTDEIYDGAEVIKEKKRSQFR